LVVRIGDLVVLPLSRQAITWAVTTATQKVIQTDRGFVRRGLAQILQNTFQGDLAKNAFIEWMQSQGIPQSRIWEYDKVRPHFRSWNRKGYQVKVTRRNNEEVTIDVNSSVPPHQDESDQYIIDNYDVKVTAGSRRNNLRQPLQLRSEVYVQIYVRPHVGIVTEDQEVRDALLSQETSATRRILQINQAYQGNILTGFAWATRNDVNRFKRLFERMGERTTWRFWWRIYWRCPIKDSRPLRNIISYLR